MYIRRWQSDCACRDIVDLRQSQILMATVHANTLFLKRGIRGWVTYLRHRQNIAAMKRHADNSARGLLLRRMVQQWRIRTVQRQYMRRAEPIIVELGRLSNLRWALTQWRYCHTL